MKKITVILIIIIFTTLFYPLMACSYGQNYKLWEKSKRVVSLQQCLKTKGYRLNVDGIFGPKTKKATNSYKAKLQKSNKITSRSDAMNFSKKRSEKESSKIALGIIIFFVSVFISIYMIRIIIRDKIEDWKSNRRTTTRNLPSFGMTETQEQCLAEYTERQADKCREIMQNSLYDPSRQAIENMQSRFEKGIYRGGE